MSPLASLHGAMVHGRRTRVLSRHLAELLPRNAAVLDVGCGDGLIDALILGQRPDLTISGVDVLVRPATHIPVRRFDGATIPADDRSVDVVMFVDTLHHTDDPEALLREARRVARQAIVVKDHTRDGWLADSTLRLMDWIGNAPHGVRLPYNYWPEERWRDTIGRLGLGIVQWRARLGLYPWPAGLLFDRSLHFVARLDRA